MVLRSSLIPKCLAGTLAVLWLIGIMTFAEAAVFVNAGSPPGGNGVSWAAAFNSLESAMATAGENQEFWVAAGTYAPSETLFPKAGSRFYGGFSGNETQLEQRNPAAYPAVIDGRNLLKHVFFVNLLAPNVRIDGFTIKGGAATPGAGWDAFGAGIFVDQQPVAIANCTFTGNSAAVQGGGVFINQGSATIENSIFQSNTSVEAGGAVAAYNSVVTISGSQFSANSTQQHGGAVYHELQSLQINNCLFVANTSSFQGGAVSTNQASATIQSSNFQSNNGAAGGALASFDGNLAVTDCLFASNRADVGAQPRGGAIWHNLNGPQIRNCTFSGNSAVWTGGGIELNNTTGGLVSGCNFWNNSAGQGGGGLSTLWDQVSSPSAMVTVEKSSFQGNASSLEGGAIYSYLVHLVIRESDFMGNSAENGGAVMLDYKLADTAEIDRCKFVGNTASTIGGAIRSYGRKVAVSNSVFSFNSSTNAGAIGVHAGDGVDFDPTLTATIRNCSLYGNVARAVPTIDNSGYGGAMANTNVSMAYLYNCIFWGNQADTEIWNGTGFNTTPDVFNGGSSKMTTHYTDMESLNQAHGSVTETHTGSFASNPLFADPDGADNLPGTLDDDLRLLAGSPCIDRADGSQASSLDMEMNPRADQASVPNQGSGLPGFADVGAYEAASGIAPAMAAPHLTATHIGTTVTLSWNPVVNASSYTLYYAHPDNLNDIGRAQLGNMTGASFGMINGAAFYVAIQANANGNATSSGISNIGFFSIP